MSCEWNLFYVAYHTVDRYSTTNILFNVKFIYLKSGCSTSNVDVVEIKLKFYLFSLRLFLPEI